MAKLRSVLLAPLTLFLIAGSSPAVTDGQDPANDLSQFSKSIEALKTLSAEPTRKEFVGRRAMSELMINGSKAYPVIKEAFLTTDHWAIKASTGFLLFGLYNGTDKETGRRMRSLMDDEHPVIRVVASILMNNACGGPAKEASEILSRPAERAIKERLNIGMFDVGWLSDEDSRRWVAANLAIVEEGKPLTDPPTFRSAGNIQFDRNAPMTITKAPFWDLKPTSYLAMIGLTNALMQTGRGHQHLEVLMRSFETDGGTDPGRMGLKFKLISSLLSHQDRTCRNLQSAKADRCDQLPGCMIRILPVCEKWLDASTDLWVLNQAINVLTGLSGSGLEPATKVMEQLWVGHTNAEVRMLIGRRLNSLRERWAAEAAERKREDRR